MTMRKSAAVGERPRRLEDRSEYAHELEKSARIKSALETAEVNQEKTGHLGSEERRLLERLPIWERMSEQELDRLALMAAAAGGEITDRIAAAISVYAKLVPTISDEYDRDAFEKAQEARRRVALLKRALALQERKLLDQKKLALADICAASRDERRRIARDTASYALRLIGALNEEIAFFERLESQDAALPAMISPGAFPISIEPDSAICAWLAEALQISLSEAQKLVKNPDVEDASTGKRLQ
jgi:hypothetical protein